MNYYMWISVRHRDNYGLISNEFGGGFFKSVLDEEGHLAGLTTDTVAIGSDTLFYWTRSLPDLALIERDSITSLSPWDEGVLVPYALGISQEGVRHVVYAYYSPDSFQYIYRFWRSDLDIERPRAELPTSEFRVWPNPFNSITTIAFSLPVCNNVEISLYDINGRYVKNIAQERMTAGEHALRVDAIGLPSGVYFVKAQAGDIAAVKKVVLIK
ncbi:T9SS type A sorting domain-containing protein [bacterium]|nr:T9SS type A sorting domain-containing protein [bacterium]